MELLFIQDAGHGWLRVPVLEGRPYGTGFGYEDSVWAYLEEDCEAPAYLADHPEAQLRFVTEDGFSDIRALSRIADASLAV